MTKIGIDMMGGDFAPLEAVLGVVSFLKNNPDEFHLVLIGDQVLVQQHLSNQNINSSNYSTAVSKEDQRRIYELYKAKPLMLENGIDENRLKKIKKMEFPKQFIIFSGSYEYFSNKQAIDDLIWIIMPKILKKFPHLKLIITGKGLPSNIQSKEFVIYYSYLPKEKLIYLIQKSNFILLDWTI
jgi:hypothetical protein